MKSLRYNPVRAILFILFLFTACVAIASLVMSVMFRDPPAEDTAIVTAQMLVVFTCPAATCDAIGVVGQNEQLHIDGEIVNGYLPVHYFGVTNYVIAEGVK